MKIFLMTPKTPNPKTPNYHDLTQLKVLSARDRGGVLGVGVLGYGVKKWQVKNFPKNWIFINGKKKFLKKIFQLEGGPEIFN